MHHSSIIGQVEGNLSGLVTINLKRRIFTSNYMVIFEFKDQAGDYQQFIPQFIVVEYERYLQFNANGYESMYMRVTVHFIPQKTDHHIEAECGSCNSLISSSYEVQNSPIS